MVNNFIICYLVVVGMRYLSIIDKIRYVYCFIYFLDTPMIAKEIMKDSTLIILGHQYNSQSKAYLNVLIIKYELLYASPNNMKWMNS